MASTVRVYKSTDTGAPAHPSSTRGSMAALLRACLVAGYGSKAPAGWAEPHVESGNKACFQAPEGARQFYQIDDTYTDADVAIIRAGESMSDVSTLIGQWGERYFGKWYGVSSDQWFVVADQRTVYVWLESQYGWVPHGFGEFDSLVTSDPYNSFCAGHSTTGGLFNQTGAFPDLLRTGTVGVATNPFRVHRSLHGTAGASAGVLALAQAGSSILGSWYEFNNGAVVPGLNYFFGPLMITCLAANENNLKLIRGKLRGMFVPLTYQAETHGAEIIDASTGKTFLALDHHLANSDSYKGQMFVDITGSWT